MPIPINAVAALIFELGILVGHDLAAVILTRSGRPRRGRAFGSRRRVDLRKPFGLLMLVAILFVAAKILNEATAFVGMTKRRDGMLRRAVRGGMRGYGAKGECDEEVSHAEFPLRTARLP